MIDSYLWFSNFSTRTRALSGRRAPVLATVALVFAAGQPALAADWNFAPRVEAGQAFTSNVDASPDESDDWITEVTPGIAMTAASSNYDAMLDYQYQSLWYADDTDLDDHFHQLNSNGQLRLIDDSLTVDLRADYDQQNVDPERSIGVGNLVRGDNRTDVGRYQIAPTYVASLAEGFDTRTSVSYSIVDYRNTDDQGEDVDDSVQTAAHLIVGDLQDPGRLDWQTDYQYSDTDYDGSDSYKYQRAGGQIGWAIAPRTRWLVAGGKESDIQNDPFDGDLDEWFWNTGVSWNPTDKQSLEVRGGERYYGTSFEFYWRRQTKRLALNASYTEEAVTANVAQFGEDFDSVIDPDRRARATADIYLRRRFDSSVRYDTAKSVFSIGAFYEDREYENVDDREQVMGVTGGWNWSLSERMRLTTTAGIDHRKFDEDDDIYRIRVELERDLNRTFQARLSAGRLDREFDNGDRDYDINGGALYVTASFGRN